jgi:3-oxoacyl-(acyl-carrier-protein) synthase
VSLKPSVVVRGMGVSCALGIGVEASVAKLREGSVAPTPWTISNLGDSFTAPVYAVPDTPSLDIPGRAVAMIEDTVREAVASAGLSARDCASLPLFIGTSAFSLDRDATRVNIDESTRAIGVQPVIAHEQITLIVQRLIGSNGHSYAFQTACTSSANAVMSATRMIELGWYEHALVIGVELANLATVAGFSSLQLIANELKPFDRNRAGIVLGEGVGAVVLSRASSESRGLFIRAGGTNIDTYRVTMSNPDGVTIADLQQQVFARSGISASDIRGIKAHGTGSPMNDTSEAAVIRRVFPEPPPVCALKSYLGHTLGACGVNELVVFGAALRAGFLPATPGFSEMDPELGVTPTRAHMPAGDGLYLLNYFGFGGHNTVMVVEQRS